MSSQLFYKLTAWAYDLLDVIYFRNYDTSPRKAVLEAIDSEDTILDMCTGTATGAIKISEKMPHTKLVGIDLSRKMLRMAKRKLVRRNIHNMKLYHMDATNMKFKDKCFDKILISLVLHETEDDLAEKMIKEMKRVLKDDGEIIITEWEPSKQWWRRAIFAPIAMLEPEPYKEFVRKDLHTYFKQFGLEVVEEIHCDYSKVLRIKKERN